MRVSEIRVKQIRVNQGLGVGQQIQSTDCAMPVNTNTKHRQFLCSQFCHS